MAGGAVRGAIGIADNVSATLQGIRRENSKFRSDVEKTRREMERAFDRRRRIRIENSSATKAIQTVARKLEPLRNKVVTVIAAKEMVTGKIRTVSNKLKALGRLTTSPTIKVKDNATKAIEGINGKLNALSALAGGMSLASGVGAAVNAYADFDDTMRAVLAKTGATAEEYDSLRNSAKELGSTTRFSASEVAKGQDYMAMAGWNANQILSAMPGTLSLAAASGEDLATVSDIMTDSMTAFGLGADQAGMYADVLAKTATKSNTSVKLMGDTFKYVAPVAGALGVSAQETATLVGMMANAGVKGSEAGTALRSSLTRLAAPPKEAANAIEALGLQTKDAEGNFIGMESVVKQLEGKFDGLTNTQQTAYTKAIFGQEAMSGMMAVIQQGGETFDTLNEQITNSSGAAQTMADTMNGGLGGAIDNAKGAVEGMAISFAEQNESLIMSVLNGVTGVATYLGTIDLTPVVTKISTAMGFIQTVIGMVNWGVLKTYAMDAFNALVGGFAWVKNESGFFKTVVSSAVKGVQAVIVVMKPIVVTSLGLIGGAVRLMYNAFKIAFPAIKAVISTTWAVIKPIIKAIEVAVSGVAKAVEKVGEVGSAIGNFFNGGSDDKKSSKKTKVDGSHFSGIKRIPYDGYIAETHKDEAIIPAKYNPFLKSGTSAAKSAVSFKQEVKNNLVPFPQRNTPTPPKAQGGNKSGGSTGVVVNLTINVDGKNASTPEDREAIATDIANRVIKKIADGAEKIDFNTSEAG